MKKENKEVFEMKKKILEIELSHKKKFHEMKMKEFQAQKDLEILRHNHAMEQQRIKSAEIRKNLERKQSEKFLNNYWRKDKDG